MWVEQYKFTVKESTLNKTLGIFRNHILPEFGDAKIENITLQYAQRAVNRWYKSHVNFKITTRYALRVMDYAVKIDLIEKNPFILVEWPVRILEVDEIENQEINFLSKEELKKLLDTSKELDNPKWYPFFRLLAFSGLRRGEALALTWKDIDFSNNKISITKTLTLGLENEPIVQSPKTRESIRIIDMDQTTMDTLKEWKNKQHNIYLPLGFNTLKDKQLVFSSLNNSFIVFSAPGHRLSYLTKKAGITSISPHGLRHTHCSLLFEAGAAIQDVQDRLGHSDIRTTMNIYNHISKSKKVETIEKLVDYLDF